VSAPAIPPGWPAAVAPPGSPGWERSAVGWLFDLCPGDYRSYDVLLRHPVVLARLAGHEVAASLEAARRGFATARADLRDELTPDVVAGVLAMYEREGARLLRVTREVGLVTDALQGRRYVPRL
jgi:hypothetical protein